MVNNALRQMRRVRLDKLIYTTLLALLLVVWMYPVALVILTSVKTQRDFVSGPFSLPKVVSFAAYVRAWNDLNIGRELVNTFIYSTFGAILATILAVIPAFALGRFKITGGHFVFILLLTGIMLPQQTVVIPLNDILRKTHLIDSMIGLIIVHGVYGMPSQLLILRGFVENIPKELESAARVDGASDLGVFLHVILPLLTPALAVCFTLNFMGIWKEFFFALVFLSNDALFPITMAGLKVTNNEYFTSWNLPAATFVFAQIPMVILYILAYRWITKGIFAGAIKG